MKKLLLIERRKIGTLKEMLDYSCDAYSGRTAFIEKKNGKFEKITYSRFEKDRKALAAGLRARGFAGKKIALIGESGYLWALVYAAVVGGTGVIVPLDKDLPADEAVNLLSRAEVGAVFCSEKRLPEITEALAHSAAAVFSMEKDVMALAAGNPSAAVDNEIIPRPEDAAALIFTSGTTGEAKGVLLTNENICSNITAMTQYVDADENDVFLSVLPTHHVYECTCGFLAPIYLGSTIAYSSGLRHIMKDMNETGATIMLGVPLIFESMYKRILRNVNKSGKTASFRGALLLNKILKTVGIDISNKLFADVHKMFGNMRLFISGAAPINPEIIRFFGDIGIKMLQGYGMTECSPIVTLNHYRHIKPKSVGTALSGVQIRIDHPSEGGKGEIFVKGPNVMKEYYHNEAATLEAIHDGWLATGDIGYIDRDGFLYITGRKKNVIINKNGKNVYPEEIETYLGRSPYIKESLVSGVFDTKDEDVCITAQIIPDFDSCAEALGENFGEEELNNLISDEVRKINDRVQSYKRIVEFKIRKEPFVKTTGNKIKRFAEKK